jgi:hypothetical protein
MSEPTGKHLIIKSKTGNICGAKMFGKKSDEPKAKKLTGPRQTSGLLEKKLSTEYKIDADIMHALMVLVRKIPESEKALVYRVYDSADAEARGVKIKNYTSLDSYPDMILYEGWFDESTGQIEIKELRKLVVEVPLFDLPQIQRQIEALKEPGNSVYFFQARGPAWGGPLGRGAAIIEFNVDYVNNKKSNKYVVYASNVIDMEPAGQKHKIMDSNEPKEIAKWVKDAHHKRVY